MRFPLFLLAPIKTMLIMKQGFGYDETVYRLKLLLVFLNGRCFHPFCAWILDKGGSDNARL
ncbi:MAG TPA: hypothetical protein DCE14_08905 [Kosmotogaceae bacterium]|nr:hypothetical protein [Kosmotogaceae bacterium]